MRKWALIVAAAATALSPVLASAQAVRSISAAERRQGEAADPQLVAQFGGRYDGPQAAFVERVGKRVAVQSGLSNAASDFRVQLLNSPVENAFAIPGGYVYVTRQLLALMNDESELAFVLGHEVGHVAARHSSKRQTTATIGNVLAGLVGAVAGDSNVGQILGVGAQQASQLYSLKYGRDQEYQADTLGVGYLTGAGYDPWSAPDILNQLGASSALNARLAGRGEAQVPTWLSTHPSSTARVMRARQLAQQARRTAGPVAQDVAFLRMLDGMRYDDDPAQGVVDGQRFIQPVMRIGFTAPQGYSINNASDAVTVAGPRGQAELRVGVRGATLEQAVAARFRELGVQGGGDVRLTTVNGRRAAVAVTSAVANRQRVDATVLAIGFPDAIYVWTMVTPAGLGTQPFDAMLSGFGPIGTAEAQQVRGKRIRIHTVRPGETIDSLSRLMAYSNGQRERFVTLNGLDGQAALRPGMLVKLVVRD